MIKIWTAVASIVFGVQVDRAHADQLRGADHRAGARNLNLEPWVAGGTCGAWTVGDTSQPCWNPSPLGETCGNNSVLEIEVCNCYDPKDDPDVDGHDFCRADVCVADLGCSWEATNENVTCASDDEQCTADYCSEGECIHDPQPTTMDCTDPDEPNPYNSECSESKCDGTGKCDWNIINVGMECTTAGTTTLSEECRTQVCDSEGDCVWEAANGGDNCGDEATDCSNQDTCSEGTCVPNHKGVETCGEPSLCTAAPMCGAMDGVCHLGTPINTGTPCAVCTSCSGGVCGNMCDASAKAQGLRFKVCSGGEPVTDITFGCRSGRTYTPDTNADGEHELYPAGGQGDEKCGNGPDLLINNAQIEGGDIHTSCSFTVTPYQAYKVGVDGSDDICAAIIAWRYVDSGWEDWGDEFDCADVSTCAEQAQNCN